MIKGSQSFVCSIIRHRYCKSKGYKECIQRKTSRMIIDNSPRCLDCAYLSGMENGNQVTVVRHASLEERVTENGEEELRAAKVMYHCC